MKVNLLRVPLYGGGPRWFLVNFSRGPGSLDNDYIGWALTPPVFPV